jgi:hypothetical protein
MDFLRLRGIARSCKGKGIEVLLVVTFGLAGCITGGRNFSSGETLPSGGLSRTPLTLWEPRDFTNAGLRVEYPAKAFYARELVRGVAVGLHPVHPSPGTPEDTLVLIKISAERMTREMADERRALLSDVAANSPDEDGRAFWVWNASWHAVPETMEEHSSGLYRLDLECEDWSIVWLDAEYIFRSDTTSEQREQDRAAMKRVLLSVECLSDWAPRRRTR